MEAFAIGDLDEINILYNNIRDITVLLKNKGIEIQLEEDRKANINLLICKICKNDYFNKNHLEVKSIFIYNMANLIAKYILEEKENKNLERLISKDYYYFNPCERNRILELTIKEINERESLYLSPNFNKISKKSRIAYELIEYMEGCNELIIDGFIQFRLKSYVKELKDAVDIGVENFLMEKEYNEFIRLLQYFVDIQEPKIQTMHILIDENQHFVLLDNDYNYIKNEYLEDLTKEFLEGEIKYEDLLISSLITISPTKIYIHYMNEKIVTKEIFNTIQKVFKDRIIMCKGCNICREKSIIEKERL